MCVCGCVIVCVCACVCVCVCAKPTYVNLRMANTQYVTVILYEGDLNIQSSSRQEGALDSEWCELLRPEMCGGRNSSFLSSCFQEVYIPQLPRVKSFAKQQAVSGVFVTYVCMYVCMYVCAYICMYVCM